MDGHRFTLRKVARWTSNELLNSYLVSKLSYAYNYYLCKSLQFFLLETAVLRIRVGLVQIGLAKVRRIEKEPH